MVEPKDEKIYSGLTLAIVWDGMPKTIERKMRARAPVNERGEGELILAPLDTSDEDACIVADEHDPLPEDLYADFGAAEVRPGRWGTPINLDYPTSIRAIPHGLVGRVADSEGVQLPRLNALSSGEAVGLSEEDEPVAGSVLYVATAAGWGKLPRVVVLDLPSAWVVVPFTSGPSKSRVLQILPGSRKYAG